MKAMTADAIKRYDAQDVPNGQRYVAESDYDTTLAEVAALREANKAALAQIEGHVKATALYKKLFHVERADNERLEREIAAAKRDAEQSINGAIAFLRENAAKLCDGDKSYWDCPGHNVINKLLDVQRIFDAARTPAAAQGGEKS